MRSSAHNAGFSLIQISILLTIAGLLMVAVLPSPQATIQKGAGSVTKMNTLITALRQYQTSYATLPCPADPTQPIGSSTYGVASSNTGTTNNCVTGTAPNAAYADTTNHIAIGMVPVQSLGLSYDYALDGYGRNITYAVDTSATGCWAASSLPGGITVNDYGNIHNTVAVLVSHGQDGYGAWLPLQGASGAATRLNTGSTDAGQAANAQVTAGTVNASTPFVSFVKQNATSTFDDFVVYNSTQFNINTLPLHNSMPQITPPANGTYSSGNVLTFTFTFPSAVTVTGTPRLALSALGTGKLGNGVSPYISYATYQSGSGTYMLTFSYTIQSNDSAPTSGIMMTASIDLNGGTISGAPTLCFFAPNLSGVLIGGQYIYVADQGNNRILKLDMSGNFLMGIGSSYQGDTHSVGSSGSSNKQFNHPTGVAVDNSGNIWVGDAGNDRIQKFNSSGTWQMTVGSSGTGNGQFDFLMGGVFYMAQLAFDTSGTYLWVSDTNNDRLQEFNSTTGAFIKTFTTIGNNAIILDSTGNIWVTNPGYSEIMKCTSSNGSCTEYGTGKFGSDQATDSDYIAIDPTSGNVWASGQQSCELVKFNSSGTYQSKLTTISCGSGDGPAGIAFDNSGNIWVVDRHTTAIYEVNSSTGTIMQTIGGTSGTGTNPVQLRSPQGLFISSSR